MEMQLNEKYGRLADERSIEAARENLEKNNIKTIFVQTGEEAKRELFKLIPEGSEVMNMTSTTLEALGVDKEILASSTYRSVRTELTVGEKDEMSKRRLGSAHDFVIGSVHAVTEDGQVLVASATGSQIGSYAYGALNVIWVVGAQKIVKNLSEGQKRLYEYSLPLENERAKKAYGIGSAVNKILIINKEISPGRITMIIVNEKLGF